MQKCDHCNTPFTYGEINKSLWLAYRPIKCRQCGTKHKVLIASRFVLSIIVVPITVFGIYLTSNFNLSILSMLAMVLLLTIPVSLLFPYLVKFSDDCT
ncbi:hypothetical protein I2484_17140 [Sporosarcina sp. E16_8]|nr:hypothetical protein [Sporosarcina sp. E16_8]